MLSSAVRAAVLFRYSLRMLIAQDRERDMNLTQDIGVVFSWSLIMGIFLLSISVEFGAHARRSSVLFGGGVFVYWRNADLLCQ